MALTWDELKAMQEEAMADDVEIGPRMLEWPRPSVAAYLEAGGGPRLEAEAVRSSASAYASPSFSQWLAKQLPELGVSFALPGEGVTASGAERTVPCKPHARCRMLAFYGVADVAMSLEPWVHEAPEWLEVRVVELPGHGFRAAEPIILGEAQEHLDRERIAFEFGRLVSSLVEETSLLVSSGPFVLFGFSFGAFVAFAVARELQRSGCRQPLALFIAGRGAPHCIFMRPAELELLATRPGEDVLRWMGENWGGVDLNLLPPSRLPRAAQLFRSGGVLGGVPLGGSWDGGDEEIPAHVASPEPLDVPILAVGSSSDKLWPANLHCEWAAVTRREFRSIVLHGIEHSKLMNHPDVKRAVFQEAAATIAEHALKTERMGV